MEAKNDTKYGDLGKAVSKAVSEAAGMAAGSIENHREREKGVIVYPVYSRRSKGLSIGINLFPDKKRCSFDCPYCEVFPFETDFAFSLEQLEIDLKEAINHALQQDIPIKDICFSGNGEPTLSKAFPKALEAVGRIREELVSAVPIVLITNGGGLLDENLFSCLKNAALSTLSLDIWLKFDAATQGWYEKINRCSSIPLESLKAKISEFASTAPVTIQTMLCSIGGQSPPQSEEEAWVGFITELSAKAYKVRKIQIYGKARAAPEDPLASVLPFQYLERRAGMLP